MKNFSSLIKESNNTIYRLCDEFDKKMGEVDEIIKKISDEYQEPLLKMIKDLLDAYKEVNGRKDIEIEEMGIEVEMVWEDCWIKEGDEGKELFTPQRIYHHINYGWAIDGWNGDYEVTEYVSSLGPVSLSEFLRAILSTEPIMSCYGIKGVKNINK
mgnify:CR=1 FL=1|tara:strand:- start:69483 stop:69950 length:468 start_codon:yes stop_codon:yes gene_type:complete